MRGWRVLVPASDGAAIAALLEEAGALPVRVPTIAIRPLAGPALDAALERGETYDWIVVTSANGVTALMARLAALGLALPRRPRWAVVGPRTAEALAAAGANVAAVPGEGVGAAIPGAMGAVAGRRVLLVRAALADPELPTILRARGAVVDDVAAYETVEGPESARAPLARALEAGVDAVVFTSGSTVRGLVGLAGAAALGSAAVVCLGPSTAAVARDEGLAVDAVAAERTPESAVEALAGVAAGREAPAR